MKPLRHLLRSPAIIAIALALFSLNRSSATIITTDTVITPGQLNYENTDVVVSNATLTVDGPHTFASLLVGPGGVVTHSYSPTGIIPTTDPVVDEPQVLAGTNEVTLAQQNIVAGTVIVTDVTGTTMFQTDTDFVVRITGSDTFLSRSETSTIPDGAMVLVSYQIPGTNVAVRLNLTITGNLEVQAGARIDADGRGLNFGMGAGFATGNPLMGSGGGHGGFGGANSTNTAGGYSYGTIQSPSTLGSRGGAGVGGTGSLGGGAIRLDVAGLAQIDGVISANGLQATNSRSGGGSGGSIWLTAQTLSGAGDITARGGNGEPSHGGGGGGGRIAINSITNFFTGTVTAYGGLGAQRGGAGTIYQTITNLSDTIRSVLVHNGNAAGAGTLVSLTDGSDLTISGRAGVEFPPNSQTLGDLLVHSHSWIQMAANSSGSITVRSNITLELGAEIRADGRGSAAGQGSGAGQTANLAQGGNFYVGTGAGYGGSGGPAAAGGIGGATYGSSVFPSLWGSGGGNINVAGTGGAGGGFVRLIVPGELRVDGRISVNGLPGVVTRAGGGSGGGIYLSVGAISGAGQIFANGGSGNNGGGNGGGGRIAVLFTTNSFTGQITAFGGTNASAVPGGAGTIYLKRDSAPGEFRYINNGATPAITPHDQSTGTSVLIAGGATVRPTSSTTTMDDLMILDHATLLGSGTSTFQVNSNATIATTARISGDAQGNAPNQGIGSGSFNFSANTGNGAGHGGYGGRGSNNPAGGGIIFGSVSNPNQLGGGGGANTQTSTGNTNSGGGVVRLIVLGNLHLDGLISVNGGTAMTNNFGGGSGGSAYISAATLSGAGRISAEGGAAHAFGGGGGGGRIALYGIATNFTGSFSAKGGAGFSPGGAGTIYLRTNSFTPSLVLDNAGQAGNNSALELNSLENLYIGAGTIVSNFQQSSVTVSNLYLGTNASWHNSATMLTLTVADAATLNPGSGIYLDGVNSSGTGNGSGGIGGGGAGHGGYGGRGSGVPGAGGNVYGFAANPSQAGSRGGGNTGSGNNGGGALRMTVGGPFQLDGRLSVNASAQATNNAGGGSGGSIWLTLNQFSGSGTLTANGGNGNPGNGGGGGGGRIAVHYFTNTFNGSLQARGGSGFVPGGAGTVYLVNRQQNSSPDLILDNGGLIGTNTPIDTLPRYNRVLITGGGRGQLATGSGQLTTIFFQLETNSSVLGHFSLNFTSNAVIAAGASILADASGTGTSGPGFGVNHFSGSGGGGHGGNGGRGAGGLGGNAHGSLNAPTVPGGSGGSTSVSFGGGGAGGGVISLGGHFLWSQLTLDGLVSADGGSSFTNGGGGGAGGAVSIGASQFSGTGQIKANGGNGFGTGGGGGGGRIAVSVRTNLFGGSFAAQGGTGWMAGGAGTIYQRTNSSSFAGVLLDNGGLRGTNTPFVQAGAAGTLDITVQNGAAALNLNLFQIRNVLVRSNGWIAQTNSFFVSQDLTIEPGGGFDLDGLATTGPGAGFTSFNTKGGGGHGGRGGNNPYDYHGRAYDSIIAPTQTGSPGGNGSGSSSTPLGGAGGGAVKVTVLGTLTLDGIMRSNGKNGDFDSGGGSGGSIWIDAETFAGSGTITANGGAGNNAAGGGGGGRIAVYSETNLFTGTMSAVGGAGSVGGGAGTVYTKVAADSNGTLRIGQQELPWAATTPLTTVFQFPTNANLFISDWAQVEVLTAIPNLHTLIVSNQSTLLSPTNGVALRLNVAGDVSITANSAISAAGRGAPRNQGPGPGGFFNGTGGGGGHGDIGGNSLFGASGGASYGWATQPTLPGSGGGVDYYQPGDSSSGGGVIRLIAGGDLRVDGNVNADGQFGWADDSGGGAGGSIWLTSPNLTGTGSITAIGGDGEFFAGGGGGGGRIAIYAPSNSFTGWTSVAGGEGAYSGGIGTIFISTNLFPIESLLGRVTNLLGQPIADVLIQATGGLTNTTTDVSGHYSLVVTGGWTGTLTPTLTTNLFVPSGRSYTDFGPSLFDQNFLMVESEAVLAPTFTWQLLGTNIVIAWPDIPGVTYQLQSSTNLVDWQLVSWGYSTFNGTNHSMSSAPAILTSPQQFFRLRATY